MIRGNTDRYVVSGERPPPWLDRAVEDPERLVPVIAEVAGSFAWTTGAISTGGRMDWLAALPSDVRTTLPDGTRLLGVHASPGRDDGLAHPGEPWLVAHQRGEVDSPGRRLRPSAPSGAGSGTGA